MQRKTVRFGGGVADLPEGMNEEPENWQKPKLATLSEEMVPERGLEPPRP
jgi:hypothetical protein